MKLTRKLIFGVLTGEELYNNVESKILLPKEQKRCRKQRTTIREHLLILIDKIILNSRPRLMGLNVA